MSRKKGGDYEVGYGKPPVGKRFKKGDRANPHGRPKKVAKTVHARVAELLQRSIEVTEGGITKTMSVEDAVLLAVGQKALTGDLKSIAFLLNLRGAHQDDKATAIDPARLAAFDRETLRRYMRDVEAREALALPDSAKGTADPAEGAT
jgi:hypothetical protein